MSTLDELRSVRLHKLSNITAMGIDAYPAHTERTSTIKQARTSEEKKVVIVGRITGMRGHGKIVFADLADYSGNIQIVWKAETLDKDGEKLLTLLDMGDFINVTGTVGKTQAGEISVFAIKTSILSKSIRPLPDKWHGLTDVEERYRQRYVDLLVNKDVRHVFELRTRIIRFLRKTLDDAGFMEVETPILQPLYGGASAKPFITHHNSLDTDLYLRIATELYLKRLIVGGFEKVYEMGKDFRNEGMDRGHNPEFTALEFYWAYADYEMLMDYTQTMVSDLVREINGSMKLIYQGKQLDFTPPWPRKTYRDVLFEYTGIDIHEADTEKKLISAMKTKNIHLNLEGTIGYGAVLDALYKKTSRPNLTGPMFLTDRPTAFVALAKRKSDDPRYTASFQLVVAGEELVNAYNELNDPIDQAKRWRESEKLAQRGQEEYEMFDDDYIRALEYGMPPTAGWGMGIDRLVAVLTNQQTLKDVILFPTLRPEAFGNKIHVDSKEIHTADKTKKKKKTGNSMDVGIDYTMAKKLLEEYIKDPITRMHCLESEAIMKALARHFGENEEQWGIIGLLHDIDWELTKTNTKEHCIKTAEILRKNGGTDYLVETIQSHGYGQEPFEDYTGPPELKGKTRKGNVQHALAASETLTGIIIAATLVQPDKKLLSVKQESLMKKFKSKSFAANCRREIVMECEEIGIPLEEFLTIGLKALQGIHKELGF